MIKCNNLSKLGKNKNLLTYLQLNYRDSLGEFSNTSYGIFGAERVNINNSLQFWNDSMLLIKFCVIMITVLSRFKI